MERAEEKEKQHQEAKEIIDAKEEKIREIEEDLREKIEENKRWRIKYDFYSKYWEQHQKEIKQRTRLEEKEEGAEPQEGEPVLNPQETKQATEGLNPAREIEQPAMEGLNPAKEIEKLEEKNEKYQLENQKLKKNNKELQATADARQESIKDLICQLNEAKKKCMILEEEKRGLIEINCMLESEIDDLAIKDYQDEIKNLRQEAEGRRNISPKQIEDEQQKGETNNPARQHENGNQIAEKDSNGDGEGGFGEQGRCNGEKENKQHGDGEDQQGDGEKITSPKDMVGDPGNKKGDQPEKRNLNRNTTGKEGDLEVDNKKAKDEELKKGGDRKKVPKSATQCNNGEECYFEKQGYCRYSHGKESSKDGSQERKKERYSEIVCNNGGECYYNKHGWCRYKHKETNKRSEGKRNGEPKREQLTERKLVERGGDEQEKQQYIERGRKRECRYGKDCYRHKRNQCGFEHDGKGERNAEKKHAKKYAGEPDAEREMESNHFLEEVVAKAVEQILVQLQKPGPRKTTTRRSHSRTNTEYNQKRPNRT